MVPRWQKNSSVTSWLNSDMSACLSNTSMRPRSPSWGQGRNPHSHQHTGMGILLICIQVVTSCQEVSVVHNVWYKNSQLTATFSTVYKNIYGAIVCFNISFDSLSLWPLTVEIPCLTSLQHQRNCRDESLYVHNKKLQSVWPKECEKLKISVQDSAQCAQCDATRPVFVSYSSRIETLKVGMHFFLYSGKCDAVMWKTAVSPQLSEKWDRGHTGKPDDDKWRTRYGGWIISLSSHECVVDTEPEVTL